jgi:hypothetical protein
LPPDPLATPSTRRCATRPPPASRTRSRGGGSGTRLRASRTRSWIGRQSAPATPPRAWVRTGSRMPRRVRGLGILKGIIEIIVEYR